MTTAHTATALKLPLRVGEVKDALSYLYEANGIAIAQSTETSAKFIVHACNAHDDLVKAAQMALGVMHLMHWENDPTAIALKNALVTAGAA